MLGRGYYAKGPMLDASGRLCNGEPSTASSEGSVDDSDEAFRKVGTASSPSPTVRHRRLDAELRRLRGSRKPTQAASILDWSAAKMSRYELGSGDLTVNGWRSGLSSTALPSLAKHVDRARRRGKGARLVGGLR